jgi:hypothetical protein
MSRKVGVIACGAIAVHVRAIARRRGWSVDLHPVPALLHNRPERIAGEVEAALERLRSRYDALACAFADCGTYGALDDALAGTGVRRLRGDHCYDLFAREDVRAALAEEPGTYFLTDFLARTFEHTVLRELGNYRRVLWLAQAPTPANRRAAQRAAERLGLPLEERAVGDTGLERELERLVAPAAL